MWFTETPWPPILICSVLAVILFAAWHARQRAIYLVGILALVVVSVAIYIVEGLIVTEAERIEMAVYEMTSAFQRGDREATLELVSSQATVERGLIAAAFQLVTLEDDLRVSDLRVRMRSQNSRGTSHFRASATLNVLGYGNIGRRTSRWELTWQREADQWKVIRIRRLNPITGEEIHPLTQAE